MRSLRALPVLFWLAVCSAQTQSPPPETTIGRLPYNAPGLLRPLYYGKFDQIGDDAMTRNYMLSLVQRFNELCPRVPDIDDVLDYGFYFWRKAQKGTIRAANAGNLDEGFRQAGEMLRRTTPHILQDGRDDAQRFLDGNRKGEICLTPPVKHLYANISSLAFERKSMPPDVDDNYRFMQQMSPEVQKRDGFNPKAARIASPVEPVKKACDKFTAGAMFRNAAERWCRCIIDAATQSQLPKDGLDTLTGSFNNETLSLVGKRYRTFDQRVNSCYE
jgi:hypothetical protein